MFRRKVLSCLNVHKEKPIHRLFIMNLDLIKESCSKNSKEWIDGAHPYSCVIKSIMCIVVCTSIGSRFHHC